MNIGKILLMFSLFFWGSVSPLLAIECGRHEVRRLEEFSDYVCNKRNMLNEMAKISGISDVRKLSLKLLADNLHSVYLVTASMQAMVEFSCNVLMCSELDVDLLTKKFESEDMGFGGMQFKMSSLAKIYESQQMMDLSEICHDIEHKIHTISMMSWQFYGRLYEMRGEPNPPSP